MDNDSQLFIVVVEDTEIRVREYVVRAENETHAKDLVQAGTFMFESESELVESLNTDITSVSTVSEYKEN